MGTSRARRSSRLAFLLLAAVVGLPTAVTRADDEVWITLERGALSAFEASQAARATTPQPGGLPPDGHPHEVVAVAFSTPRLDALSAFMHRRYRACPGFVAHPSREDALAEVARAAAGATAQPAPHVDYTIDNGAVVRPLMANVQANGLRAAIATLQNYFTRYHRCPSGSDSAAWIKALWEGFAQGRGDVTVEFFDHGTITPQPSVILTIPGAPGETGIVVIGGHQDSYAGSNCSTSRSPGADDNASGIAVVSEVIRAALALGYHPQKTVKFMAYAAEEVGLFGSGDIADTYLQQGANVVGVLNLDMTNYMGSPKDIYLVTDNTSAAQNTFVGQLVDTYLPTVRRVGTLRGTTTCGYGCSDHASWSSRGYAASFPFEATFDAYDPFIHTEYDTLANMGNRTTHALKFTRLAAAYLAELAKGSLTPPPAGATSAAPDARAAGGGRAR